VAADGLQQLVERQARRWAIDRRAGMPHPRGPCVAISRLPASGGDEVAARVAEWLDYGLFGLDGIDRLAADPSLRTRLQGDLAPEVRAAIESRVSQAFGDRAFAESPYLRSVVSIVATLGERGMAVVLGRGATAILTPQRALRVLVVAPAAARVARLVAATSAAPDEAARRLVADDAARGSFLRSHFGVEIDDATLYDLVVNTAHLSIDAAAALVVDALRRRFPPV
jgi:Cytidylate kinase-like family